MSPLYPLSPLNPLSPFSPLNPVNPLSPLSPGLQVLQSLTFKLDFLLDFLLDLLLFGNFFSKVLIFFAICELISSSLVKDDTIFLKSVAKFAGDGTFGINEAKVGIEV